MIDKKIFIPRKLSAYIFLFILVGILVLGILNSPLAFLSSLPNEDTSFKIGLPVIFFELNPLKTEEIRILWKELFTDLLVYLLIAYFIELIFKFIMLPFKKEKAETKISLEIDETMKKAKLAYEYYLLQGISEQNLIDLFKQKGWTEEEIKKIKELK
jgi:ACR3 family arsenite efflux pump ArsB